MKAIPWVIFLLFSAVVLFVPFDAGATGDLGRFPAIGSEVYSDSCYLLEDYGDGALARCLEDGAVYVFDADGNMPPAEMNYDGPTWVPGWYVCTDGTRLVSVEAPDRWVWFLVCDGADYSNEVGA